MKRGKVFGAGMALLAMGLSIGARAADDRGTCLTEAELSALTVYVMPQAVAAVQASCKGQLSPQGFVATGGAAMVQRYAAKSDQAWPLAKSAFVKFAGGSANKDAKEFVSLPDSGMRPFLDAFFQQKIAEEVHPKSCQDIERLAQVVDRIDPDTTGALVGVIAALALGKKDNPKICANRGP